MLERRLIAGLITKECADAHGDTCDYESTKPAYQRYSAGCAELTNGQAFGILCESHKKYPVGKAIAPPEFDDDARTIRMIFEVSDADIWEKVLNGFYTGFSHWIKVVKRWNQNGKSFYTGQPVEISVCRLPVLRCARLEVVPSVRRMRLNPPAPICPICGSGLAVYGVVSVCNVCGRTLPKGELGMGLGAQ
jgi:hypothetical protein